MIRKISAGAGVALMLVLAVSGTVWGAGWRASRDTLKSNVHTLPQGIKNENIGPEFAVSEDALLVDEDRLPAFSEVLGKFQVPFKGKVISRYGMRHGRMHTGTDIKLYKGDTVYAAYDGVVSRASRYYGYGNLVVVNHSHGLETYYAHLSAFLVQSGDTLRSGQPLGLGGRTGRATTEHLHFEIREKGRAYNPELVYDFENFAIREDVNGKEALAELIRNPKTGENIKITSRGNSYVAETPAGQVAEYVIKAGDSLWEIARRFNTSVGTLCEQNNLTPRSILRIGAVIKVFQPSAK
jgi:murein DD-endopeptidase MepM/ murein hydrolase activator NlpD